LNQIEEGHTAAHILLRDADHKTQVSLDQLLPGLVAHLAHLLQPPTVAPRKLRIVEPGTRLLAALDRLGQINFFLGREEGCTADLA
jgi:hypothetical protein